MHTRATSQYSLNRPARVFYRWLKSMGLNAAKTQVQIAIVEGRYEPDDRREICPHAVPAGTHKQNNRNIGPLSWDCVGAGPDEPDHEPEKSHHTSRTPTIKIREKF